MLGLTALPLAWKVAGAALLALAVAIAFGVVYAKGISTGEAKCQAAVAQALAKQQADDKALSDKLLDRQKGALDALHAHALSSLQRVTNAPITSTCGPVQRDASRSVQSIVRGSAEAP